MKKLNNFWFGFLLAASIAAVIISFLYADAVRGYDATGGEVFMLALPLFVLNWRKKTLEQSRNKNSQIKQQVQHKCQQPSQQNHLQDIQL
jgi:preprotein translocase subunit SecF